MTAIKIRVPQQQGIPDQLSSSQLDAHRKHALRSVSKLII
jgi:hypothetical protein